MEAVFAHIRVAFSGVHERIAVGLLHSGTVLALPLRSILPRVDVMNNLVISISLTAAAAVIAQDAYVFADCCSVGAVARRWHLPAALRGTWRFCVEGSVLLVAGF